MKCTDSIIHPTQILDEVVLQGSVQSFTLQVTSAVSEPVNLSLGPTITSTTIPDLTPNTDYTFVLTVFVNGGMSKSTGPVLGRTADGGTLDYRMFFISKLRLLFALSLAVRKTKKPAVISS